MKKIFIGAAFAALASAGAASAGTVNASYQTNGGDYAGVFGTANLYQQVKVTTPGPEADGTFPVGMYSMTSQEIGDFLAFCVDLAQYLANPTEYTVKPDLFTDPVLTNINKLFYSALNGAKLDDVIDTSIESAALQVALWEVVYDSSGVFDLDSGNFSMSQNDAVEAQAEVYLAGLPGATSNAYNLTFLYSADKQDLVTLSPVPLPATGLLFGVALAGLGVASRRRKKA